MRDVFRLWAVARLDRDVAARGKLPQLLQPRFLPNTVSQQDPLDRPAGTEGLEHRIAAVNDVRRPRHGLPDPLPAGGPLGVVQLDAHPEELLPDLVRAAEVPAVPGPLPLGDQAFDLGVDRLGKLDDIEDAVRMPEHRHRTCALFRRRLSRLEPGIEELDELEEMTDRGGQIEVVVESLVPAASNIASRLRLRHAPEPHREFIEALD